MPATGGHRDRATATLQAWAQASNDAILVERRKVAPFGIYTLVCFERTVPAAA